MSAPAASTATCGRCPHWSDPAHQAAISAAYDSLAAMLCAPAATVRLVGGRGRILPAAQRIRELGRLAAASRLPARAAVLRWTALPPALRQHLLADWFGQAA